MEPECGLRHIAEAPHDCRISAGIADNTFHSLQYGKAYNSSTKAKAQEEERFHICTRGYNLQLRCYFKGYVAYARTHRIGPLGRVRRRHGLRALWIMCVHAGVGKYCI